MTIEASQYYLFPDEMQLGERKSSPHRKLNDYLREVDKRLTFLGDEGVSIDEVAGLIGFEFARSDTQVLKILRYAQKQKLIKTEPSGQPISHKYKCEHLLVAAAAVQIRTQGVIWKNMPYALYHYLTDPTLREVVNKPREPYGPTKKLKDSDVEWLRILFDNRDWQILIALGEIDLSAQTVLSDIPEDFLRLPGPVVSTNKLTTKQSTSSEKEITPLSSERLGWLHVFLTYDSPIKPYQMDLISTSRLQLGGFALEEAEAVFREFSGKNNSNGNLGDDDKTYYALDNAIAEVLRTREISRKNTGAIS